MAEDSPRFLVAQLGARQGYAVPTVLHGAGLLECLCTDVCASLPALRLVDRLVPRSVRPAGLERLLGRKPAAVPDAKIVCFPWFAATSVWRRSRRRGPGDLLRFYAWDNRRFCDLVVRHGFGRANAVYGYNGASLEILKRAREEGLATVLEQTSSPAAREQIYLDEEAARWPQWELSVLQRQDWEPLADREMREWELADRIVCGSQWVTEGMAAVEGPVGKCRVVPYSVSDRFFCYADRDSRRRETSTALRVLFLGNVRLLKGIQYFMEAARLLAGENVQFRAVGPSSVSHKAEAEIRRHVDYVGPVPRSTVPEQLRWADVLVLPTLSEGSALVCYEALAAGLPVVTTPNAGSVVRDGAEGYIVPIRAPEAIACALSRLAADRQLLAEMSRRATARAAEFTHERYAERLLTALSSPAT